MEGPEPRPEPAREPLGEHRMPGWVRAFVAIGVLLVVLVVLGLILGRADHGPSRHLPGAGESRVESDEDGGNRPPVQHP